MSKLMMPILFLALCCVGESVIGTWVGAVSKIRGGGYERDSFGIVLTISDSGYSMLHGNKQWGSSLYIRDSTRDAGTWKIDSIQNMITFFPDSGNDSCSIWRYDEKWQHCLGYSTPPLFCDCPSPMTSKINISDNLWTIILPGAYENDTYTYFLINTTPNNSTHNDIYSEKHKSTTNVHFFIRNSNLHFSNIQPQDKITLYNVYGRVIKQAQGTSSIILNTIPPQMLIVRVNRSHEVIFNSKILVP